jgi:Holliday junction DNA helicase RuvA
MIGWLSGRIIDKEQPGHLVLDVNGVGYDVETSLQTFFILESQPLEGVSLHIHTVVREDALILFGFFDKTERSLFRALIKVNGIGPKVAIGILSNITPSEFIHTVRQHNIQRLTQLPGIGKKTAERLLIEMKDAISSVAMPDGEPLPILVAQSTARREVDEALSALESLGYKHHEALAMLKKVDDQTMSCEALIRQALKQVG